MKRFVVLLLSIFVTVILNAQSKSDKLYDEFADKEGVTNFSFSKNMLDVVDIDLGDEENERNVSGDLHQIRFLTYNPKNGSLSGSEFYKKAIGLLPAKYKKYEEANEEDSNTEIWLLGRKKKFSECHLFVKNESDDQRCFVVSFYGDFNVNDLDGLKRTGANISN